MKKPTEISAKPDDYPPSSNGPVLVRPEMDGEQAAAREKTHVAALKQRERVENAIAAQARLAARASEALGRIQVALSRINKQIETAKRPEGLMKLQFMYGALARRAKELTHVKNNPRSMGKYLEAHHDEVNHDGDENHDAHGEHAHEYTALHQEEHKLHEIVTDVRELYNQEYRHKLPEREPGWVQGVKSRGQLFALGKTA